MKEEEEEDKRGREINRERENKKERKALRFVPLGHEFSFYVFLGQLLQKASHIWNSHV